MTQLPDAVQRLLAAALRQHQDGAPVPIDAWNRIEHAYSNEVFRVRSGTAALVVRLVRAHADVQRPLERLIMSQAADAGITPRPRHMDAMGNAVFDDLQLATLQDALHDTARAGAPASITLLRHLASALRRLHGLPLPDAPAYHPGRVALAALQGARQHGWPVPASHMDLARHLAALQLRADRLCHNDLNPTNILLGQRTWLIDWEWAAPGDPHFDLVTLAEGMQLDRSATQMLFEAYGAPLPHADELHHLQQLLHLREYAWAVGELATGRTHPGVREQMEYSAARLRYLH